MLVTFALLGGLWLTAAPWWGAVPASSTSLAGPRDARAADSPAALLDLSDEELATRIESDPASLGSLSIGAPGRGRLFNPASLPPSPNWEVAPNADTWGTSETLAALQVAVDTVHELFPDTPPVFIGDISGNLGGRLHRHESHQSGRDVDLGYYYKPGLGSWATLGTAANLDLPRNWALVRALLVRTDVEAILLDIRVQRLLYQYALSISEDKDWLDHVFQCARGTAHAIIRHWPNHRTHYHVRFYNPVAQELGRRAHPYLVEAGLLPRPLYAVQVIVRAGQTLSSLAARYGTSVRAIMAANGLTSAQLRVGRAYRIPVRSVAPPSEPLVVPRRLLPPQTPAALAAVSWPTEDSLYGASLER
jgi:penicillin-insensitive murein endopeptidase